jgi:hypothetical protein
MAGSDPKSPNWGLTPILVADYSAAATNGFAANGSCPQFATIDRRVARNAPARAHDAGAKCESWRTGNRRDPHTGTAAPRG